MAARLSFNPQHTNEEAGLVLRANEKNHYEIGVTLRDGKRQVFFRKTLNGKVDGDVLYEEAGKGDVVLAVGAPPLACKFSFQPANGSQKNLGSANTADLSSEKAGGFTGVYMGMYATGNGQTNTTPADFDWFEYSATENLTGN